MDENSIYHAKKRRREDAVTNWKKVIGILHNGLALRDIFYLLKFEIAKKNKQKKIFR